MPVVHLRYITVMIGALVIPANALAFDVDRFRSGMTRSQLSSLAQAMGLEAKELDGGSWAIGKFAEYRLDGTFSFCGDGLVSYIRPLDFDADCIPMLRSLIEKNGQPLRIRTTQGTWSGPGGGIIHSVEMVWRLGKDRITLAFHPEGRDGKGQLRHYRASSIAYATENSCFPASEGSR